ASATLCSETHVGLTKQAVDVSGSGDIAHVKLVLVDRPQRRSRVSGIATQSQKDRTAASLELGFQSGRLGLMPKELFGTDGIRGEPGKSPLDDATLYATGRSLGAYLHRKNPKSRVLIGMDTRESGPHIAAMLAAGLAKVGVPVAFAGVITTPGVA